MTKNLWLVGVGMLAACGGLKNGAEDGGNATTDGGALAADTAALSGVQATDSESALAVTTLSGATFVVDGTASANAAATAAVAAFTPSGCATQVQTGPKVVYTFDDCSGPYGLVHVQGSLTVTYNPSLTAIGATLSSSGLKVGSTSLTLAGSAKYTSSGGNTVVLTPSGSATLASGTTIAWSGDITTAWTPTCVTVDGSYAFTVDGASWSVAATDYQRCAAACPAAGGSIALSGPNASLSVVFDGTSTASYTTNNGSGTLPLLCGS